jgi:hypothetical protein
LLAGPRGFSAGLYQELQPARPLGLPFRPLVTDVAYFAWPLLSDLFPVRFTGVKTSRDDVVVEIDKARLVDRMTRYFDPNITHEDMRAISRRAMQDAARFDAEATRDALLRRGFLPDHVVRFGYRPFDLRWLYWEPLTKLLDEKRPEYYRQVFEGNLWLAAAQQNRKDFDPPCVLRRIASIHIIERSANVLPMLFKETPGKQSLRRTGQGG